MTNIAILGISLLISFTVFLFGPLEMLLTQAGAFHFGVSTVILPVVFAFLAAFALIYALLSLCQRLKSPWNGVPLTAFFVVGVLLYLQGNWFFAKYGIMDGTAIDWGKYGWRAVANTLVWTLPPLAACLCAAFSRKIPEKAFSYVSLGIVAVELLSLLAISGGRLAKGGSTSHGGYHFTSEGQFHLSSDHDNVLVVCADSFDGFTFSKVLKEDPALKDAFDGFTFFPDTVGTSLLSEDSVVTLLTGNQFDLLNVPFAENVDKAWKESFFNGVLKEYGYATSLFMGKEELVSASVASQIKNARQSGAGEYDKAALSSTLFKMVMFKYAPHLLKKYFWYTSMDFDLARRNVFSWDNIDFWRRLREDGIVCVPTDGNVFHFYWIKGAHLPITMTRDGEPVAESVFHANIGVSEGERRLAFEQSVGVARLFADIVKDLKNKGIYDRTVVIFSADHGWKPRENPLLLVKPRGGRGKLRVSMAPVSMIQDWSRSFDALVRGSGNSGDTVFDIPEGCPRNRPFYTYELDLAIDRRYNQKVTRHYFTGEMLKQTPKFTTDYLLGKPIFVADQTGFGCKELDPDGTPFVWAAKKRVVLPLKLDGRFRNLRLDMDFSTFNGVQRYSVRANDWLVAEESACGRSQVSFVIPHAAIGDDGLLTLRFGLPDAVSPHSLVGNGDLRTLSLKFYSLKLSSTDQKNAYEYDLGTSLSFAKKDGAPAMNHCVSGFSKPEENFTWTSGKKAEMRFLVTDGSRFANSASLKFSLHYRTYLKEERVAISANGRLVADFVACGEETRTFQIPEVGTSSNGVLNIEFDLPDAISPHDYKGAKDKRRLALRLYSMTLE